jgi:UDP-N-acetylmuramate dehydrogenase
MPNSSIEGATSNHAKEAYSRLSQALGSQLRRNVLLASHTTFGIGGNADLFYQAREPEELIRAVMNARNAGTPFFVLGGGSNLLVSDSGFRGLVIKNECSEIVADKESITCQSGALLADLVDAASKRSLSGLEFAAGIPGTVGGAARGNAGAFGVAIGDVLTRAVVLTASGKIEEVDRDYFRFGYRDSRLKHTTEVLLSVTFKLDRRDKGEIEQRISRNLSQRKESIPWQDKSAGCFFKNVDGPNGRIAAGYLLDQVGAKGMQEGDVRVSDLHANVLVNVGNGRAREVARLAQRLKEKVRQEFGIELQEEVVYIN